MKRNFFSVLLEKPLPPRTFVGNSLRVLEYRVREIALIALADWQRAEIPAAVWLEHVPDMISAVGKLQRPSWGHWNGLLRQLDGSRKRIEKRADPAVAAKLGEASYLKAVLEWLATRTPTPLVRQVNPLAALLGIASGKKLTWHAALEMPINLRNQIVHYTPSDAAWWAKAAEGLRPLIEALAADHDSRPIPEPVPLPRPWFIPGGSSILSFGGMKEDFTPVYLGLNVEPCHAPDMAQEVMVAFRQLLGAAEAGDANFRRLLSRLLPEEQNGVQLGEYLVGKPVGEGGFARVHVGWQISTGRKAAIKILHDGLPREYRLRFQDEAGFLGQLDHRGIVGVLGHGVATWTPRDFADLAKEEWFQDFKRTTVKEYIALEFLEGPSLEQVMKETAAPLPSEPTLIRWFAQAAEALSEVHKLDLIHRDVKPSNLIVTPGDRVKLLDFGIARSHVEAQTIYTHLGKEAATPVYAAPEQLRKDQAERVGPRSDIYGLCATFYELFCRGRLYDYDQVGVEQATSRKLAGEPPVPPRRKNPRVPWEVEVLLLGGLQDDIGLRPNSARELAEDLRRIQENQPIEYRRPPFSRRVALWGKRHKRPLQVAAAATLAALIASGSIAYRLVSIERGKNQGFQTAAEESKKKEAQAGALAAEAKKKEAQASALAAEAKKKADLADAEAAVSKKKESLANVQAVESKKSAEAASAKRRRSEYEREMRAAFELWNNNQPSEVRTSLDRYDPRRAGVNEDLRGFEWYYLDHLANSGVRTWKVGGQLRAARFSPDGDRLAVLGFANQQEGNRITIFMAASGKVERILALGRTPWIDPSLGSYSISTVDLGGDQGLAFSPDGTLIAGTCVVFPEPGRPTGVVKVWETITGKEVMSKSDAAIGGLAVAFSPDGRHVLAGGYSFAVLVWDLSTRELTWTLTSFQGGGPVSSLVFLNSGFILVRSTKLTAMGGEAATRLSIMSQWPPAGGRLGAAEDLRLLKHPAVDENVVISPDGRWGVLTDTTRSAVHLKDVSRSRPAQRPAANRRPSTKPNLAGTDSVKLDSGPIKAVAAARGGIAVVGSDGLVTYVRIDPEALRVTERRTLRGHTGMTAGLAFSQDGTQLVAVGLRDVTVWDLTPPSEEKTVIDPIPNLLLDATLYTTALHGRWAILSRRAEGKESRWRELRLMSSVNDVSGIPTVGESLIIVAVVNNVLHFRIFDEGGKVVVDTDEKKLTKQAELIEALRKQVERLRLPHELTRYAKEQVISAIGSIVGHTEPLRRLEVVDTTRPEAEPRGFVSPVYRPSAMTISPDGSVVAISGDGQYATNMMRRHIVIHLMSTEQSGKERILKGMTSEAVSLMFDREGKRLVSASRFERVARLWNVGKGVEERRYDGLEGVVEKVEFSADGRWIVAGDASGAITIFSADRPGVVRKFRIDKGDGGEGARKATWALFGELLAFPDESMQLLIWNLEKDEAVGEVIDLGRRVDTLAFLGGGTRLVSSNGQKLTLWSVETRREILSLSNGTPQARQFHIIVERLNHQELKRKAGLEQ